MASGNFHPKTKADPAQKSFNISIRLNPRKPEHRWAAEYLAAFDAEQARLPEDERQYRGDLIVAALQALAGVQASEPTVTASARDVERIGQIVEYIMDRIDSGAFTAAKPTRKKREQPNELSDSMKATIDRYTAGGFTGGSDLDED